MTHIRRNVEGDEPIGEEPGATVTTGNATIKSSTEVSLSGSFVLEVWGTCHAIVMWGTLSVKCLVLRTTWSDGRWLSVKRGELWTKSLAG